MRNHSYKEINGESICDCGAKRTYVDGRVLFTDRNGKESFKSPYCDRLMRRERRRRLVDNTLHNDGDLLVAMVLLKKYFIKDKMLIKDEEIKTAIRIIESSLESNGYAIEEAA